MTRTLGYSVLLLGGLVLALCGTPSALARAAARTARPYSALARVLAADARSLVRVESRGEAGAAPGAAAALLEGVAGRRAAVTPEVEPRFRAPLREMRSCKPRAPIELRLEQTGASDGSIVDLQLQVVPHPSVGAVRWELLLPDGAELLDGESRGELAAGAGSTGPRHVRVRLPPAADFSRVSLVAASRLAESAAPSDPADATDGGDTVDAVDATDAADPVRARISLGWGQPPSAARARPLVDVARGDPRGVAVVPATHRVGR